MSAISQSEYISSKTVAIRKETVSSRNMGALFMTQNALVPFGNPISFTDYNSVCLHFGAESDESKIAKSYFGYTEAHTTKQTKISFGRYAIGSTTISSLLIKKATFTYKFALGPIFDAKCKWVLDDGTVEEITGEEAVARQYLRYQTNDWVAKHEGEVLGYRPSHKQDHVNYFAIVRTTERKVTREKRTMTLNYNGEVASYDDLPKGVVNHGSFYAIAHQTPPMPTLAISNGEPSPTTKKRRSRKRPSAAKSGVVPIATATAETIEPDRYAWWYTNKWVKLVPSQVDGTVVDVLDTAGNPIYDTIQSTAEFDLVPLIRINSHVERGSVESLDDLNDVIGSFGDTYTVKDRFGCQYTSDGYNWYQCAYSDEETSKVIVNKLIGSQDVADISEFYRKGSNAWGEHLNIKQETLNTIQCTNLGTKVFLSDLPTSDMSQGDMYYIEEKGCYYAYGYDDEWIALDFYVKTFDLPLTTGGGGLESDSGSSTIGPYEDEQETGTGYYHTSSQVRIPMFFTKYMETYGDLAEALQKELRLYSDFSSVVVDWVYDGTDYSGKEIGHFEITSEDSVGISGIVYNPIESATDFGRRFGFETQEYRKVAEYPCESALESIQRISADYNDFGSFAFIDDISDKEAVARWNLSENYKYLYSFSSNTIPGFRYLGTAATLRPSSGDTHEEVIPMAIFAATYYEIADSIKNFMFQQFDGFEPSVFTDADKSTYDKAFVNYIGRTQEHGRYRDYFQRGVCLDGTSLSVYCAEVWLQDKFTTALLNLLLGNEKLNPNVNGLELVSVVMTPHIQEALSNGMIQVPASIDDSTKVYIDQITGVEGSWKEIQNDGFALVLNIEDNSSRGGKCFTYTLVYNKAGVIRHINGLHAFREQ